MSRKTELLNMAQPGDIARVRGFVHFSHIATQYEGAELERRKEEQRRRNMTVIDKPYTTITLHGVEILCANPQALTPLEQYLQEKCYQRDNVWLISMDTKGRNVPRCFKPNTTDRSIVDEFVLEAEPAKDTGVTLVIRVFKGQNNNNGASVDSVLFDDPDFKYFSGGGTAGILASLGIKANTMSDVERQNQQNAVKARTSMPQAGNTPEMPYGQPAYAGYGYAESQPDTPYQNNAYSNPNVPVTPQPYAPAPAPAPGTAPYGNGTPNPVNTPPAGATGQAGAVPGIPAYGTGMPPAPQGYTENTEQNSPLGYPVAPQGMNTGIRLP